MNTIKIKHGGREPSVEDLAPYELGYVHGGELYINNNGSIVQLTGKLDENLNGLIKNGNLTISQFEIIAKSDIKQNKILVTNDNNQLLYRTPDEILEDVNGFSKSGGVIDGDVSISNNLTVNSSLLTNGAIVLKEGVSYGYENPNDAEIPGVKGQIYFLLSGE